MRGRSAILAVVGLACAATLVDAAGRLADGLLTAAMVAIVVWREFCHQREIGGLRRQVRDAQAREIAAGRGVDAVVGTARAERGWRA